jgi:hypothetical protein
MLSEILGVVLTSSHLLIKDVVASAPRGDAEIVDAETVLSARRLA